MTVIARVKIMPKEIETKPEDIINSLTGLKVLKYTVEPIAFGLNATIADFSLEDQEGGTDELEGQLLSNPLISDIEVLMVSNASTRIKHI